MSYLQQSEVGALNEQTWERVSHQLLCPSSSGTMEELGIFFIFHFPERQGWVEQRAWTLEVEGSV